MTTTPRDDSARDSFAAPRALFETMIDWLDTAAHDADHAALETGLIERGDEVLRTALQAHLDQRFEREREALRRAPPQGCEVRARHRELETRVGRVRVRRAAIAPRQPRAKRTTTPSSRPRPRRRHVVAAQMPADRALSLPQEIYSLPLREQVARQAVQASFERVGEQIDALTSGHVPQRQRLELVERAAQDVDAFYAARTPAANDTLSAKAFEVMSADAKGVQMRPEGLREATRKEAERERAQHVRGDPMASRRVRPHTRRMAVVTANWEQEPRPRKPADILGELRRPRDRSGAARRRSRRKTLPRPQNKRVRASLEQDQQARIEEMFEEATRRDPARQRRWVALIDGSESQREQVRARAEALGVALTIIVDVIHVLHYLWQAAQALTGGDARASDAWVSEHLLRLMTRPASFVVSGLRQSATLKKLCGAEREAVDGCAKYLEDNAPYVDYGSFLKAGMPIATGVIEGACRYVVNDRMGITGARWGVAGGEAVLKLRSVWVSGDWDDYWAFHLRQEHERNYPSKKVA